MRILMIGADAPGLGAADALRARLRLEFITGQVLPFSAFCPEHALPLFSARQAADALERQVLEGRWDAVAAAHPLPALALTRLQRAGRLAVPVLGLVAGYALDPRWARTGCSAWALGHGELLAPAAALGLPPEKLCVTGVPVYRGPGLDRAEARAALGVPRGGALVLAPDGCREQIDALLHLPDFHPWVAVPCTDDGRRARLERHYARQPRVLVRNARFPLELWLGGCNALFARPDDLLLARAAARQVPLVLLGSTPGAELFERNGMALCVHEAGAGARAVRLLCQNTARADAMRRAQQAQTYPDAAGSVYRMLLQLVQR